MTRMYPNLAISGKMGSGKSTIAGLLRDKLGYRVVSLATPIYEIGTAIAHKDFDRMQSLVAKYNLHLASDRFASLFEQYKFNYFYKNEDGTIKKTDVFRGLLQEIGNAARDTYGERIWAIILLEEIQKNIGYFVCDDVRSVTEKEILASNGFKTIRLDVGPAEQIRRLQEKYGHVDEEKLKHSTETALDAETFNLRIDTDSMPTERVFKLVRDFVGEHENDTTVLSQIVQLAKSIPLGKRDDWVRYFMAVAYIVSLRSTCGSRRVGAVLVDSLEPGKRRILATGYNGYPSGAKHCMDGGCPRFAAKKKSGSSFDDIDAPCHAFHAEHNVLNQILASNISSQECILFCTTHPCINCARMIHGAGIKTVYYAEGYPDELSKQYFKEFDIDVIQVDIH